jgi:hypothetical protein
MLLKHGESKMNMLCLDAEMTKFYLENLHLKFVTQCFGLFFAIIFALMAQNKHYLQLERFTMHSCKIGDKSE